MLINTTEQEIASFFTRQGHATTGQDVISFMNLEIMPTLTNKVKCNIKAY